MVMGHTFYFDHLHQLIYGFHMPLFFVLSGYCIEKKYTIRDFVKKRFKSLMLPFLYFAIIEVAIIAVAKGRFSWSFFYPDIGHVLWFLPVMFVAVTTIYSLARMSDKIVILLVLSMCMFGGIITDMMPKLPYSLNSILFAFVGIGGGIC